MLEPGLHTQMKRHQKMKLAQELVLFTLQFVSRLDFLHQPHKIVECSNSTREEKAEVGGGENLPKLETKLGLKSFSALVVSVFV